MDGLDGVMVCGAVRFKRIVVGLACSNSGDDSFVVSNGVRCQFRVWNVMRLCKVDMEMSSIASGKRSLAENEIESRNEEWRGVLEGLMNEQRSLRHRCRGGSSEGSRYLEIWTKNQARAQRPVARPLGKGGAPHQWYWTRPVATFRVKWLCCQSIVESLSAKLSLHNLADAATTGCRLTF